MIDETKRIVEWLRANTPGASINPTQARKVADALEQGVHLQDGMK